MHTADFQYALPPELIAQHPASRRDASRLLVLHRLTGQVEHREFGDLLSYLRAGDVLVLNNSRVIPARLRGVKAASGGELEALLVEEVSLNEWWAMLRPGKRVRVGTRIEFPEREPSPALRAPSPVGRERAGKRVGVRAGSGRAAVSRVSIRTATNPRSVLNLRGRTAVVSTQIQGGTRIES